MMVRYPRLRPQQQRIDERFSGRHEPRVFRPLAHTRMGCDHTGDRFLRKLGAALPGPVSAALGVASYI